MKAIYKLYNPYKKQIVEVYDKNLSKYKDWIILEKRKLMQFKKIKNPKYKFYCGVNGYEGNHFGYASAWQRMAKSLEDNNIQLSLENSPDQIIFMFCPPQNVKEWYDRIEKYPNQKVIVMSAWECDNLHPNWVKDINDIADVVATTTPFFVDIFKKAGIKKPVTAWEHGVNMKFDSYKKRSYKKGDDFYFFIYNAGERRKGWNEILDVFESEFANEHNVKLIAKNNGKTAVHAFHRAISKRIQNKLHDIIKIEEILPFEGLVDLAHKSHCFLFPSYGEGYGMPVFEMMATGLPCIVTQAHRYLDIPQDTFIPVDTTVEKGQMLYNVGNWWKPDKESLRKQMRWVYENYDEALQIGDNGYNYVIKHEDIDKFTKNFLKFLTNNL